MTALWAAIGLRERGPDGKYPVRRDDDPALDLARVIQVTVVRQGLRQSARMIVNTSRRGQEDRRRPC